jgi:hypothetical protein
MNKLIVQIKNDIKNCENKNNHIKRYQSLICNLCNESFNDNILRGASTKLNQLMNDFVKDFYKFTNMKSSGSNNDKKIKTISYKHIPYQVILNEILEFYQISYSDIFDEYVGNEITYENTPFIKIKKFVDTLRTEWKGDFKLSEKKKIFLDDTLKSDEFKDYKSLKSIAIEYLIKRNELILYDIEISVISQSKEIDFSKLFHNFYGIFKQYRTRKIFLIFRSVTNIIYERNYDNITLNLFGVRYISLIDYLERNPSFSEYSFIPKNVKFLQLNYEPYDKFSIPYFSRFEHLISLNNFNGDNLQINTLIKTLKKHSQKLKKLGLIYKKKNYEKINIFEEYIKIEHLDVYILQDSRISPSIKFNINMLNNLKTFEFGIQSTKTNHFIIKFTPSKEMISELKNCEHLIFDNFIIEPTHVYEISKLNKLNKLTLEECELFTKINETTAFTLLFKLHNIKYLNIIDYSIEINMNQLEIINSVEILGRNLKEINMYDLRRVAIDVHYYDISHIDHSTNGKEIIDRFLKKLENIKIKK